MFKIVTSITVGLLFVISPVSPVQSIQHCEDRRWTMQVWDSRFKPKVWDWWNKRIHQGPAQGAHSQVYRHSQSLMTHNGETVWMCFAYILF